jgi:hypothetical protein
MLCQQDKARGGEVEKVRRLTYAHGWQCDHKVIIMGDCACICTGKSGIATSSGEPATNCTSSVLASYNCKLQNVLAFFDIEFF